MHNSYLKIYMYLSFFAIISIVESKEEKPKFALNLCGELFIKAFTHVCNLKKVQTVKDRSKRFISGSIKLFILYCISMFSILVLDCLGIF